MTVSSCFSEKSQHTGISICNFLCLHVIDMKKVSKIVCVCMRVCIGPIVCVLGGCQRTAHVCPVRLHVTILS